MLKALMLIAGASASLGWLMPLVGAKIYALVGIVCGMIAAMAAVRSAVRDHVSYPAAAGAALALGVVCGMLWPSAIVGAIIWLNRGGWGDASAA